MTEEVLTFPAFKKSWGDEWFEQGIENDCCRTKEGFYETFQRIADSDVELRMLLVMAAKASIEQRAGDMFFIDDGNYLVIPLDHCRDMARQAHNEVRGWS